MGAAQFKEQLVAWNPAWFFTRNHMSPKTLALRSPASVAPPSLPLETKTRLHNFTCSEVASQPSKATQHVTMNFNREPPQK